MKFSEYCDMVENTENDQQLIQYFREMEEMDTIKNALLKAQRIPVVGKACVAIVALTEAESLAAFKETEHYQLIKDWNFNFDPEAKTFSFNPSSEQMQKAMKVMRIVSIVLSVVTLTLLCRKLCRRKKNVEAAE